MTQAHESETKQETGTIRMRNPRDLRCHPLNRTVPRINRGMAEWAELVADIQERGVREPLAVTPTGEVVDGETRRGAAIAAGIDEVPTIVLPHNRVMAIYREKLLLQKHLTKGQRAYVLWPLLQPMVAELQARQSSALRAGLRSGRISYDSVVDGTEKGASTLSEVAQSWGFSHDILTQARTLHGIFDGDGKILRERNLESADLVALRNEWEPKILDLNNPVGLGAALAGMAGAQATSDQPKAPNAETQLELFNDGASTLGRVAKSFPRLKADARAEVVQAWRRIVAPWPPEMRTSLGHALLDGLEGA